MAYQPEYPPESPYNLTRIVGKYLTYYTHRIILPDPTDRVSILNNERYVWRPDLLAQDLYGSDLLWWVIPVRNGMQDPIFDLTLNRDIIIVDPIRVRNLI